MMRNDHRAESHAIFKNPLMPNRYNCTYVLFIVFKLQLLQKANIDLVNPRIYKAHYSEQWEKTFSLQIKPLKVNSKLNWRIFIFASSSLMG